VTECIIGTCLRPAETMIEGQARCRPHAAELALILREEPPLPTRPPVPPLKRNIIGRKKFEVRRFGMQTDQGRKPLLVRFLRRTGLGRGRHGEDVVADIGDVIDLCALEDQGILTGSSARNAEEFARSILEYNKGELVDEGDRKRVFPPGPVRLSR
jgi:hypothetical protein